MKRKYFDTGLYAYLEAHGADTATPEILALMRQAHWAEVKRKWKVERRKMNYEATIYFNNSEVRTLDRFCGKFSLSRPKYIKQAALNELQIPETGELRTLLARNYNALLDLCKTGKVPLEVGELLLFKLEQIEQLILSELSKPRTCDH